MKLYEKFVLSGFLASAASMPGSWLLAYVGRPHLIWLVVAVSATVVLVLAVARAKGAATTLGASETRISYRLVNALVATCWISIILSTIAASERFGIGAMSASFILVSILSVVLLLQSVDLRAHLDAGFRSRE